MERIPSSGDHFSRAYVTIGFKQPTRELRPGRPLSSCVKEGLSFSNGDLFSYLVLLQVTLTLPPVLPQARWALTPPFHPYLTEARASVIGGIFSVALVSDCSAWALPSTLPYGVRTFLSWRFRERSPGPLTPPVFIVGKKRKECKGNPKTGKPYSELLNNSKFFL